MYKISKMKFFGILLLLLVILLATCNRSPATSTPALTTATKPPPTPTSVATQFPKYTPFPTLTPTVFYEPSPTPISPSSSTPTPAPVEGYWIQNTTRNGLCTDSPRFITFDTQRSYLVGGEGATVCSIYPIEPRMECGCGGDCPREILFWHTFDVPTIDQVASGTFVHPSESEVGDARDCYNLPSFAGNGGYCASDLEGQWQCLTQFDDLPFHNIRAHGAVEETGVEWFLSDDSLTSRGLQPQEQFYAISALFDESDVRLTWLAVPATADEGVWVGTNGHGLLHILSSPQQVTRYTVADGLPDEEIRDIQTCGINCVWVATPKGIGRWDGSQWVTYTTHQGLPSDDVRGISFDSLYWRDTASVWAVTAAGPARFVKQADRWQGVPGWPAVVEVTGLMGMWVSTRGQGLLQFIAAPAAHGGIESFTTDDGLPDNRITALAATARGVLVGTPRGAVEWDGATWISVLDAPVNDASSEMIGTESGLWVWNGDDWEQMTGELVTHVTEDGWYTTEGQVCQWTGGEPHCPLTDDGKLLAGAQSVYVTPDGGTVAVVSSDGELWEYDAQACDGGCLVIRGYRLLDACTRIIPPRINDLVADEEEFWIATDKGIYSGWAGGGDRGLAEGWPVAVRAVSLNGQIVWLATDQGAYYTDPERRRYGWSYVPDLPDRDLSVILPLPDGSAWIGTVSSGLIHFEPVKE